MGIAEGIVFEHFRFVLENDEGTGRPAGAFEHLER
jgi:hypothetical protein